ncbi:hypothetical protein CPB84DRAFT_1853723 [Gymnopilus junonius]|uniref:Uncharacterized protein n=1 Tax=Gymnopilus junonius TaxID=109634 RepID=A0A9P5N9N6_GYMJU|nr:hypothetical protein CPB84DRAFT_1853723 [Gymnopilus junonius]
MDNPVAASATSAAPDDLTPHTISINISLPVDLARSARSLVVNVNLCGTGSDAPPAAFSCPHSHQGPTMELGAAAECPAAPDAATKAERTQEPAEEEEILSEMEPDSQAPGYQCMLDNPQDRAHQLEKNDEILSETEPDSQAPEYQCMLDNPQERTLVVASNPQEIKVKNSEVQASDSETEPDDDIPVATPVVWHASGTNGIDFDVIPANSTEEVIPSTDSDEEELQPNMERNIMQRGVKRKLGDNSAWMRKEFLKKQC